MKGRRSFFRPLFLTLVFVFSSLLFAADLFAQKTQNGASGITGSFVCGVCDPGFASLSGANWDLCWQQAFQQGIRIRNVCFMGQKVLYEATQPFILAPYHGRNPLYKDGLSPQCGGASLSLIPNTTVATVSTDDENPGYPAFGGYGPGPDYDKLEVASTYHSGWYRYRQRWIFHGTGDIDALLGFGGFLAPFDRGRAHFHSSYWRLDFDLDDYTTNYVEEFTHPALNQPDNWTLLPTEGVRNGVPSSFNKWRVRSDTLNAQGLFHAWEIVAVLGATHEYGTAEFWPLVKQPGENGEIVGSGSGGSLRCSDQELQNVYSTPAEDISSGADIVVWVAAHAHHEPRHLGEEGPRMPGFEWEGIHLSPRNFLDSTPEP